MDREKTFRVVRSVGLMLLPVVCLAGLVAAFTGWRGGVGSLQSRLIQFAILANLVVGVFLATLQQEESKEINELRGYWATMIATGALLPSTLALVTVIIYLGGWAGPKGGNALLWGAVIAVWAWFVAALVCRGYASATNAIPSSYGELNQRLTQIKAGIKRIDARFDPTHPEAFAGDSKLREAVDQVVSVENELKRPGPSWVLARGYVNVWNRQYRAEESLIEAAPLATVLSEALYDEQRLHGSEIQNRDDLLAKLRQAVNVLDPSSRQYLKPLTAVGMPLTISTPSTLPDGVRNGKYVQPLLATGGTTPYTWEITSGEKPEELKLEEKTGLLTGTPLKVKDFAFTVRVTDHGGQWAEKPLKLTINDEAGTNAPVISTHSPLPEFTLDKNEYLQTLKADGGTAPYKWKIIDGKPQWLELNPDTGVLKGTPGVAGEYSFVVEVTDSASKPSSTEKPLRLTVIDPAMPRVGAEPAAVGRAVLRTVRRSINEYRGQLWNGLIVARNRLLATMIFTALTAYALLVVALLCNASRGAVTAASIFYLVGAIVGLCGRLRAESQTGTAVEDYGLSAARLITIPLFSGLTAIGGVVFVAMLPHANTVFGPTPPALAIQSASPLPVAEVGETYKHLLQAKGGTRPYKWEITAGQPDWLKINSEGVLAGNPTKAEAEKFSVQVTDNAGATEKKEFALTVRQKAAGQETAQDAMKKPPAEKPAAEPAPGKAAEQVPDDSGKKSEARKTPAEPAPKKAAPETSADAAKKAPAEKPGAEAAPGKAASVPESAGAGGPKTAGEKAKTEPGTQSSAPEPVGTPPPGAVPSLTEIFNLDRYPIALLVAAVFGLTPGLLFDKLLQQAEKYKSDLTSSQAAGESTPKAQKP